MSSLSLPRLLVLAILLLGAAGAKAADEKKKPPAKGPPTEKVVIGGERFKLEVAADRAARTKGLMGRQRIDDHGGMLFVFRTARKRSFWMKDCLIDMDLIMLDARGRIIRLHKMKREPPRQEDESVFAYERRLKDYSSNRRMQFAIELEAGSIDRLKLETGRTIRLDLRRLRKMAK